MSLVQQSDPKMLSTWTPLNNDEQNRKVFFQRKELFLKWFEKWSATQRKKIIDEILSSSNWSQLQYISDQVCWYWKYLCELDQLWMLKCLKLDWNISFTPSPYEHGLWKRNYIENFKALQYLRQQVVYKPPEEENFDDHSSIMTSRSTNENLVIIDEMNSTTPRSARSQRGFSKIADSKRTAARPAWRGSDPVPKDTIRYNYLNNTDQVETVKMLRNRAAQKQTQNKKTPRRPASCHDLTSADVISQNRMNTAEKSVRVLDPEGVTALKNYELTYGQRPTWAEPDNKPSEIQGSAIFEERMNKLSAIDSPKSGFIETNKQYITAQKSVPTKQPTEDGKVRLIMMLSRCEPFVCTTDNAVDSGWCWVASQAVEDIRARVTLHEITSESKRSESFSDVQSETLENSSSSRKPIISADSVS